MPSDSPLNRSLTRWRHTGGRGERPLLLRISPPQLFVLSFASLILVGTLGFLVLPGLYTGPRLGPVDALFTATSAVCVTGLIVVDTAQYFTVWGQGWILLLIQAGGLGILTFTTLLMAVLGRRASLRIEEAGSEYAALLAHLTPLDLFRSIVAITFAVEAVGAAGLWLDWRGRMGSLGALWPSIFHAVSAFCNAGFSTFSDSLVGFRESPVTLGLVAFLVIVGGLGFVVVEDIRTRYVRKRSRRLTIHTRIVLVSTAVLIVSASVLFLVFEWRGELRGMSLLNRVTNASFMAVTPRTAGFNSVSYDQATDASVFLTIILMVIGGAPGSTAGGLKTTTCALLFLLMVSRLRGRKEVSLYDRTIPHETVQRAVALVVGGLIVLGAAVFLLSVTEFEGIATQNRSAFVRNVFEAHSAFGTVGLSMGATGELSVLGRIVVTALMFVGRVGPLALVASMAAARTRRQARFRYGEEDVIIG